jgi:multidrug transporter EmrE-like cation transporter
VAIEGMAIEGAANEGMAIEGVAMSLITWLLILSGVGLNAAAQLLLKAAAKPLGHFTVFNAATVNDSLWILARSVPFWCGMLCYAASVCVWVAALSKAPVSTAYPMLSLGYVVVAAVSAIWMGEILSPGKVLGIALICAGVVLVSRSSA